ncbi:uncharacterized protein LOC136074118 [Hydra vulgaris]|uniref:Uncharacterized protein LOC136074118 n=1 Tax=Hydra vulgaris TaxID=6087 RepID=A0ABM4B159_HYDVU
MFAVDIVICSESRELVEVHLERWRYALESRGMKVSRSKTEYMCVNEKADGGQVQLQVVDLVKVDEFTYLGSRVQCNGGSDKEVKKRVQAGWCGWHKVSGVICDRRVSARMKGKIYRSVVRPAILYGLETVALTKRQVREMEVSDMKMLRFSFGVIKKDRIRNEFIRGSAHVQRRQESYIGRKVLGMELSDKRRRGRPKRRFMDAVVEDMRVAGVSVEGTHDRARWRSLIRCGDP